MNKFGISLYLSTGYNTNKSIIEKAILNGASYAFTSLQIPEENINNYNIEVNKLLELCNNKLNIIVDISPETLTKLNINNYDELKALGITHIRLDYGFSYDQIIELTKLFNIVFNASTFSEQDYKELKVRKANFKSFIACHNFYPKPYTGLSINKLININKRLKGYGMKTMAFIPSDNILRGPLYLGLPTLEEHRNNDVLYNLLELKYNSIIDIPMIADIAIKDETYSSLNNYINGYITLKCTLDNSYSRFLNVILNDRIDSSEYLIRCIESRTTLSSDSSIAVYNTVDRTIGSICIGNIDYKRYNGELEICKKNLGVDSKVNVIGNINAEYIKYIKFIGNGIKFKLIL